MLHVGAVAVVDENRAVDVELDADRLEAESAGVRGAPGGVEHRIGHDRAAVAENDLRRAVGVGLERAHLRADAEVDTLLDHLGGDVVADVAVEAAQDLLAAIELRHARTQAVEDGSELARDVAAADDSQARRETRQVEDLVRADRAFAARHVGRRRPAPGGDDDPLGTMANAGDLDLVRADDARATAQQDRARARQKVAVDVVEAADLDAPVCLQRLPVERRSADAPAEAVRFLEALGVVGGEAVQLLRNATDVDAGAAERAVFGDRDARAALRRHARSANAAAAGADDEEVEERVAHSFASTLTSAPS